jgi:hypothetical protein
MESISLSLTSEAVAKTPNKRRNTRIETKFKASDVDITLSMIIVQLLAIIGVFAQGISRNQG